ncbi:MAG: YciI family protein [Actinomycetota bacterium]|nr:YciI family protein [Actinomycetota bacterium]
MKYLLLICVDPQIAVAAEEASPEAWFEEVTRRGAWQEGHVLAAPTDATTVRVRGGAVQLTDGPFAETKELLAGFDILECADLDEAVALAQQHPVAKFGAVEVRAFAEQ